MLTEEYDIGVKSRFQGLFAAQKKDRCSWEQAMLVSEDFVVVPTLGSIVPNWLLVIPKSYHLNFHNWSRHNAYRPHHILEQVRTELGVEKSDFVWFEHGANQIGSETACGVDHAHLHLIIKPDFSFSDFRNEAFDRLPLNWEDVDSLSCYDKINEGSDYLVFGNGDEAFLATRESAGECQFFRKVIAKIAGQEEKWNYREYFHAGNIAKTLEQFKG